MKNLSIKTVVAIGIGAALFFVVGRFVAIPTMIPNTFITIQYAILGLFGVLFGPIAATAIGFIGHTLIDLSWGGSPWWSWIIASAVVGLIVSLICSKINVNHGKFDKKDKITYAIACVVSNAIAWIVVAPALDVLMYAEPLEKVMAQAVTAATLNSIGAIIVGIILLSAYAKTRTAKGSLSKD